MKKTLGIVLIVLGFICLAGVSQVAVDHKDEPPEKRLAMMFGAFLVPVFLWIFGYRLVRNSNDAEK
jgi:hypothetical protein